jgi:enoyl-CoA hydratase/carnithine racemase
VLSFWEDLGSEKMVYKDIVYRKKEYVAIIDLVGIKNDIMKLVQLCDELMEVCLDIILEKEIRVVILNGEIENSFSIEPDLIHTDSKFNYGKRSKFWSLADPIAKIEQPVIAAINGNAFGRGLELALASDMRICSQNARFSMPQVAQAKFPCDGGTQRLSRLVGKSKGLELILVGEMIDAQEAFQIGLVSKVVPSDQLMVVAMDMAREMVSKSPIALRYAKEAIHKGMDLTLEQGLRLEADLYLLIHTTKDWAEGIQAFREKRTPKFEGR